MSQAALDELASLEDVGSAGTVPGAPTTGLGAAAAATASALGVGVVIEDTEATPSPPPSDVDSAKVPSQAVSLRDLASGLVKVRFGFRAAGA